MIEKRRFTRIPYQSHVTVNFRNRKVKMTLKDLSLKGARIDSEMSGVIPLYSPISLQLDDTDIKLDAQGLTVFRNKNQIGVKFTGIGESSLNSLVRLMRKQCQDSSFLDHELTYLKRA